MWTPDDHPLNEPQPSWDYKWGVVPIPTWLGNWVEDMRNNPKRYAIDIMILSYTAGLATAGLVVAFWFYFKWF